MKYWMITSNVFRTICPVFKRENAFDLHIGAKWRHTASQNLANVGPGNGLLPEGTKRLAELMLTNC